MRAAVLQGPGALAVQEVLVPALGADDVLVAIDLCGVCGSDLHMVLEGWGEPGS
jgi:D-arabinose 1-dehydrogenase-like Zn-dependent alcohol dehydrogenase